MELPAENLGSNGGFEGATRDDPASIRTSGTDIALRTRQLEELCESYESGYTLTPAPYWSAEIYGFGKYIRKYGYFPSWLPLCVHTDHGPGIVQQFKSELTSSAPVQLFHSPESVDAWKAASNKPCFCLYSPFVFGRRVAGIERDPKAEGTIAFPGHTTIHLKDVSNVKIYIDQLKALPAEFQPVSVCLHPTDVQKGLHNEFLAEGLDVETAGHAYDDAFSDRFYDIVKRFKYSTSNYMGSYAYYCVEMDIPFFLFGQEPEYINIDDPNVPLGNFSPYNQFDSHRRSHDLFASRTTRINAEQRTFALTHLGVYHGLSRPRLAVVLYYALVRRFFMGITLAYALKRLRHLFTPVASKARSFLNGVASGRARKKTDAL